MATGGRMYRNILSDETFDLLCRVCKRKGKHREAEKYCVECQDYYCLTCVKVHEDIPSLTGHEILDKDQFPSGSVKMPRSIKSAAQVPTERCEIHIHNCIDMYCQNHDVVGCGTCMAVDHRLCKDIFYIPEFVQTSPSTTTAKTVQQQLNSIAKTIKEHQENFKQEKQNLLKKKATILENVKTFREEINKRLDELEKNTIADVEDKYNAVVDKLEKAIKILQVDNISITAVQGKLASSGNNPSQIFVNIKRGERIAGNVGKNIEENKPKIHAVDEEFEVDQRMFTFLREINVLGNFLQKEALRQARGSKKYCVKVQTDKEECDIGSACTLEDGTVLLSDINNDKLKRLDSSTYKVIDYCDLPWRPWQVCSINKHQAAVCLPDQQEVHFISLPNRMTLTNTITTNFECYGLACAGDNLYISDWDTSVYIYSVSGRKLKKFSENQSGRQMFSNIRSLAVCEDGSRIYVADYDKGLITLDNHGKIVRKFNGPQLRGAFDSYLTGKGSLLVYGDDSTNVLQFGLDGELIGEVVEFGDVCNQTICCNQQMTKMIIGGDGSTIKVYNL